MAKLTEERLKESLAKGEFLPAYCFYGSETYLITHYVSLLAEKTVGDCMPDFNLNRIEGDTATVTQILEAAESMPALHSHRCVLVRDFSVTDHPERDLEELKEYLANPCPTTVLIFYYTALQPGNTAKWKALLSSFEKAEGLLKFTPKTQQDLVRILVGGAGKRGCRMTANTADYLIQCVGTDLNTLLCEMEKLCAYRMNTEITVAHVDKLCAKTLSATAFQMVRAIIAKNPKSALKTLTDLFANREEPVKILGALSSSYVNLYRAITAQEASLPLATFGEELKMKNPSALQYSLKDACKLGGKKIDRSLHFLCQQDEKLKSLPVDGKIILQQTVVGLIEIAKE